MIGKTFTGGFSIAAVLSALRQLDAPSLSSPQSLLIQNGFIIAIGTWALIELIRQGKRMATREDVTKLRDDMTAAFLEHQGAVTGRIDDLERRTEKSLERELGERERVTDLQLESLQRMTDSLQSQVEALRTQ